MSLGALVFDAYGTLYDVQSVLDRVEQACPGRGMLVTQLWRLKQLEYTWLRTCMDAFEDFAAVTHDSLVYALHAAAIEPDPALVANLADAYLHLQPVPEAAEALQALTGNQRVIFSNGSASMLQALVRNSGLAGHLEHVISVDAARAYKPSPQAYALLEPVTGVAPRDTLFISSNGFDVAGAKRYGFQVAWIRRAGSPYPAPADAGPSEMFRAQRLHAEELGETPDHVLTSLTDVAHLVASQRGA